MPSSQAHPSTEQPQPPVCKRSPGSSVLPSWKLLDSIPRDPVHLLFIKIVLSYYKLSRRRGLQQRDKYSQSILYHQSLYMMKMWISVSFPILILAGGRIDDDKRLSRDVCLYEKQGSWTQRRIGRIIWSPGRWKKYCSWPKRSFGFFCYIVWKHTHTHTQEKTWTNFLANPI